MVSRTADSYNQYLMGFDAAGKGKVLMVGRGELGFGPNRISSDLCQIMAWKSLNESMKMKVAEILGRWSS